MLHPGSMAKARKTMLSDIISECQSDRFNVPENFPPIDMDYFIKTGSTTRKKSRLNRIREHFEKNLKEPEGIKACEVAVTFKEPKKPIQLTNNK